MLNDCLLFIFDLDGTLYSKDREKNYYRELQKLRKRFIAKTLGVPLKEADRILAGLISNYGENIDITLETEYGVPKPRYYAETAGSVPVEDIISYDPKLRCILCQIDSTKSVLTNAPSVWAEKAIGQLGIADQFGLVMTCDDGIVKPQEEAFLRVCRGAAVEPKRAIAVGDNPQRDLYVPRKLGMKTVSVGVFDTNADFFIDSIYGLPEILR
ncbi:MAG: HAD hydrolase-like protein [Candidatus Aenigmarchaeota archaeon]|nr:HAD hydrolase-like protein [Candidatus Aenigmarchaeota archaeon]